MPQTETGHTHNRTKSEIHDCTINLAKLLSNNGILTDSLAEDIAKAKQTRIDIQYYVEKEQNPKTIKHQVEAARKFVLETEKAIENLSLEQINNIRTKLTKHKINTIKHDSSAKLERRGRVSI